MVSQFSSKSNLKVYINYFVIFLTVVSYLSSKISPEQFWICGFISWTMPILLIINILFILYWLITKQKYYLYSAVTLIFCYQLLAATVGVSIHESKDNIKKSLKILNYNVRVFNVYEHLGKKDKWESTKKMTKWILDQNADVICLQEFYTEDGSKDFDIINKICRDKKMSYYFLNTYRNNVEGQFGMIIFSKYKIINKGVINFTSNSNNQNMFIDIKFEGKTLRIYNIHLHSMSLNENDIPDFEFTNESKKELKSLSRTLKRGFIGRAKQIDSITKTIYSNKIPSIVCGDFNDLPYGYAYQSMSKVLQNSFESKGLGLGFTFNGKIKFLRIDNQFYDAKFLKISSFKTYSNISYSDHYPLIGQYYWKN